MITLHKITIDRACKTVLIASLMMSTIVCTGAKSRWHDTHFHRSMQTKKFMKSIAVTERVVGIHGVDLINFFKALYDKNSPSALNTRAEKPDQLKVKKIFHQIWLGSELPEAFRSLMRTWVDMHPDWVFLYWVDKDINYKEGTIVLKTEDTLEEYLKTESKPGDLVVVDTRGFMLENQKYYNDTTSYGVKSDVLKWEIVYRYGGVYVDMDYEALQPIDEFNYLYDFYTAIQPLDTQYLQLGAALFGGVKGHPILRHCIDSIKTDWHKQGAPAKSGPIHFTHSFYEKAGKTKGLIDIAFPALYFYPQGCMETNYSPEVWIKEGAYAIHHWAKSWMPAKYRRWRFKKLNNDHLVDTWRE